MSIGTQLRNQRKARRWTQADAAKHTGLDRIVISKIENGRIAPSLEMVQKLVAAYRTETGQTEAQPE